MAVSRRKFKTEVQQLLDLVIHSLYTNKDIFLRELISNASDAIDRLRFEALSDKQLIEADPEWKIKISMVAAERQLIISDNGIGMSRAELEKNIGTIANSGTRAFLKELQEGKITNAPELIGQFGVGFYASFMVADKVTLLTRRAGSDETTRWESSGDGNYTMRDAEKTRRGTDVILHLKEGLEEYLEEWKIRKIVKQYSDFVEYPVVMDVTRQETPTDDEGKPVEGAEPVTRVEEETLNSMKAIWMRPKAEVTEEQYHEFYKHISHDYVDPLEIIHYAAEGVLEFKSLLYIPSQAPFDLFFRDERKGLHLYVKRVFITDDCQELLPDYLRFVRGVVESNDLPLNVSREILQENAVIRRMQRSLTGKVLSTLQEMREKRPEDYLSFWLQFGRVLKEGVHFDFQNKEKLQELLLFASSTTEAGTMTSLKEYVDRMPAGQSEIFYLIGPEQEVLEQSPYLEACRERGYEVLFMTDPIDEWVVQSLTEYGERKLRPIDRGALDLGGEDEDKEATAKDREARAEHFKGLLEYLAKQLEDEVKEVTLSTRLTDSIGCLVQDEYGVSPTMERLMRSMNQEVPPNKRILEVNPSHPLLELMHELHERDAEDPKLKDYAELIHGQALLAEGSPLKQPMRFARLVTELMVTESRSRAGDTTED